MFHLEVTMIKTNGFHSLSWPGKEGVLCLSGKKMPYPS